jgi:hypothetical protein
MSNAEFDTAVQNAIRALVEFNGYAYTTGILNGVITTADLPDDVKVNIANLLTRIVERKEII